VDLLVVGLGLESWQEVHASDRETWQWQPKGHNGDQALVCLSFHKAARGHY
jgi:hypothetical protein